MTSVDRILDVIDAGLQTPAPDPTFGEVSPKVHDRCVRCQTRQVVEDSDFCQRCRAYLLGDDPADDLVLTDQDIEAALRAWQSIGENLAAAFAELTDAFADAVAGMAEALTASAGPWLPAEAWDALRSPVDPVQRARARRARPDVCPVHGPAPGGLCRRCSRRH